MKFTFWILAGLIAINVGCARAGPPSTREIEVKTKLTETKINKCLLELDKLLAEAKKYILALGTVAQNTLQLNNSITKRGVSVLPTKVVVMEFPSNDNDSKKAEIGLRATNRTGALDEALIRKYLNSLTEFNWVASCLNGGKCKNLIDATATDIATGSEAVDGSGPGISTTAHGKSLEPLEKDTPTEADKKEEEDVLPKATTPNDSKQASLAKNLCISQSNLSIHSGVPTVSTTDVKQSATAVETESQTENVVTNAMPRTIVSGAVQNTSHIETTTNEIKKPLSQGNNVSGVNQKLSPPADPVPILSVQRLNSHRGVDELGFKDNSVVSTSENQNPWRTYLPLHLEGSSGQEMALNLTSEKSSMNAERTMKVEEPRGEETSWNLTTTQFTMNKENVLAVGGRSEQETPLNLTSATSMYEEHAAKVGGPGAQEMPSNLTTSRNTTKILAENVLSAQEKDSMDLSVVPYAIDHTTRTPSPPLAVPKNDINDIGEDDEEFDKRFIAKLKEIMGAVQRESGTRHGHPPAEPPLEEALSNHPSQSELKPEKVDDDTMASLNLEENAALDPIYEKTIDVPLMELQGEIQVTPVQPVEPQNAISHNRFLPLTIHMKPVTYNSYYVKRETNDSDHWDHDPKRNLTRPKPEKIENGQAVTLPLVEPKKCDSTSSASCSENMLKKLEKEYQDDLVTRDGTDKRNSDDKIWNGKTVGSLGKDCESNVYFFLGDQWAKNLIHDPRIDQRPQHWSHESPPDTGHPGSLLTFPPVTSRSSGDVNTLPKSAGVNCIVRGKSSGSSTQSTQSRAHGQNLQRIDYLPSKGKLDYEASLVNFPLQKPVPPVDLKLKPTPKPDEFMLHDMPMADMMSLGLQLVSAFPLTPDELVATKKVNSSEEPVYGVLVNGTSSPSEYIMGKNKGGSYLQQGSTLEIGPYSADDDYYFDSGQYVKPHYSTAVISEPLEYDATYDSGNKNYFIQHGLNTYEPSGQTSALNPGGYNLFQGSSNSDPNSGTWSNQGDSPVNTGLPYKNYPTQYSSSSYPGGGYSMQSGLDPRLLVLNHPVDPPYRPSNRPYPLGFASSTGRAVPDNIDISNLRQPLTFETRPSSAYSHGFENTHDCKHGTADKYQPGQSSAPNPGNYYFTRY